MDRMEIVRVDDRDDKFRFGIDSRLDYSEIISGNILARGISNGVTCVIRRNGNLFNRNSRIAFIGEEEEKIQ